MRAILALPLLLIFTVPANPLPSSVTHALSQVRSHCSGFHILSVNRPGARVAGTHRRSLHSYGLAADFRVNNYGCAYSILSGWPYGLSLDARSKGHAHISDGRSVGRHEGRFYHGGGRHYASRHRQGRHHRRYARS